MHILCSQPVVFVHFLCGYVLCWTVEITIYIILINLLNIIYILLNMCSLSSQFSMIWFEHYPRRTIRHRIIFFKVNLFFYIMLYRYMAKNCEWRKKQLYTSLLSFRYKTQVFLSDVIMYFGKKSKSIFIFLVGLHRHICRLHYTFKLPLQNCP